MSTEQASWQVTPKIVIADDDPDVLRLLKHHFTRWGYQVHTAVSKEALWREIHAVEPDFLILDLQFGPHDGLDVLSQLTREGYSLPTLFLTAHGSIDGAVKAIQLGALDFLTKPPDLDRLRRLVKESLTKTRKALEAGSQGEVPPKKLIIGESPAMRRVLSLIEDVSPTDAKVMILGETGTGKELVARAIHERSQRADQAFVSVNMATLPANLAESVLFGHERGAFTGAVQTQKGWCEGADQGTLFLDEIGETDLSLQAKLLTFLQSHCFQRVGSIQVREADVRVIAATNRDPQLMVRERTLREDLYYRLNVVPIVVPPLRERREDIRLLANFFLDRATARFKKAIRRFSDGAVHALERYAWPGNVRQLENLVDRLVILSPGDVIDVNDLPLAILSSTPKTAGLEESNLEQPSASSKLRRMDRIQREAIIEALRKTNGSVVQAANVLGVGQATIYRKVKRYGIPLPSRRPK